MTSALYDLDEIKANLRIFRGLQNKTHYDLTEREQYNALKVYLIQTIPYLIGRIEGIEASAGESQ